MQKLVYLDNNATTPLDTGVIERMLPFLSDAFGNPSSAHRLGHAARGAIEHAREQVAGLVNSMPEGVLFTASATEAINTAIRTLSKVTQRKSIVVSAVEHDAVLMSARALEGQQIDVVSVPVDQDGHVKLPALDDAITPSTQLVCVMWVNNETGVISRLAEVASLCAKRRVPLFVDAVQAAGKLPVSLADNDIDLLAISAHKMFGPKGVGALIARDPSLLQPLIFGGNQERGRRAGTENVAGIVGFGEAASLSAVQMKFRSTRARALRDELEASLLRYVPGSCINGDRASRVSNTSNIWFDGVDSDDLVQLLDADGVCVSSASACHSDSISPSHVILAMSGSYERAKESVRFSVSHLTTQEEIAYAAETTARCVEALRRQVVRGEGVRRSE